MHRNEVQRRTKSESVGMCHVTTFTFTSILPRWTLSCSCRFGLHEFFYGALSPKHRRAVGASHAAGKRFLGQTFKSPNRRFLSPAALFTSASGVQRVCITKIIYCKGIIHRCHRSRSRGVEQDDSEPALGHRNTTAGPPCHTHRVPRSCSVPQSSTSPPRVRVLTTSVSALKTTASTRAFSHPEPSRSVRFHTLCPTSARQGGVVACIMCCWDLFVDPLRRTHDRSLSDGGQTAHL